MCLVLHCFSCFLTSFTLIPCGGNIYVCASMPINMALYITDHYNMSHDAYHGMAQLFKSMPRHYQLQQKSRDGRKVVQKPPQLTVRCSECNPCRRWQLGRPNQLPKHFQHGDQEDAVLWLGIGCHIRPHTTTCTWNCVIGTKTLVIITFLLMTHHYFIWPQTDLKPTITT